VYIDSFMVEAEYERLTVMANKSRRDSLQKPRLKSVKDDQQLAMF